MLTPICALIIVGTFHWGTTPSGNKDRIFSEFLISSLVVMSLCQIFKYLKGQAMNLLAYIGQFTLAIYVCHFYFVGIPFLYYLQSLPAFLQFVLLMVFSIPIAFLCISIKKIIEPLEFLHFILYGKYPRKDSK